MLLKQIIRTWKPLSAILTATILCAILYSLSSGDTKNFALSLGTCFLSALVVIIAVDISLSARTEHEKSQLFHTSLHSLRPAFVQIGGVMFNMIKATTDTPKEDKEIDFSQILKMMKGAEIQYINARHEAPVVPKIDWLNYITSAFIQLSDSINKFSEKYIIFIDKDTIELSEKLAAHQFILLLKQARGPCPSTEFKGDFGAVIMTYALQTTNNKEPSHFHDCLSLIEQFYNKLLAANIKIMITVNWGDNFAPALGSAKTANR